MRALALKTLRRAHGSRLAARNLHATQRVACNQDGDTPSAPWRKLGAPHESTSTVRTRDDEVLQKVTAVQLLEHKHMTADMFKLDCDATIADAIEVLTEQRLGMLVAVEADAEGGDDELVGIITVRDILRLLNKFRADPQGGFDTPVREMMTPAAKMVFVTDEDSLGECTIVMSEVKVRSLPVLSKDGSQFIGCITLKDIADLVNESAIGGKDSAMRHILGRRGVQGAKVVTQGRSGAPLRNYKRRVLKLETGATSLAHPHKGSGVSEDAHFVVHRRWGNEEASEVVYIGVADGVGSWREHGVDPSLFSSRLMVHAEQSITQAIARAKHAGSAPPRPEQVLKAGWKAVLQEQVIGSSTACVATVDNIKNLLVVANIGDSGIFVLRRHQTELAGTLGNVEMEDGQLFISFRSQQQLHDFNQPYQLGFFPEARQDYFSVPKDANIMHVPIQVDDIVLLATDGLFDNMEEAEMCAIADHWENQDLQFGGCEELACRLAERARELSLDDAVDSPFAILAKENDIMWGGGMPDDITVVAARVYEAASIVPLADSIDDPLMFDPRMMPGGGVFVEEEQFLPLTGHVNPTKPSGSKSGGDGGPQLF